jgi:hypothetical protein
MSNTLTRRAVVTAAAAAVPALPPPALANSAADPIFALIEQHRQMAADEARCLRAMMDLDDTLPATEKKTCFCRGEPLIGIIGDDPRWIDTQVRFQEIYSREDDLEDRLLHEPPTTLAGVVALLRYVHDHAIWGRGWPDAYPGDKELSKKSSAHCADFRGLYRPADEQPDYPWSVFLYRSLADALESIARKAVQS